MNQLKQKENNKKNDLSTVIEERIKEYDSAIKYFKENGLDYQLQKGEEDKNKLVKSLENLKTGKEEINEKNIPKEITFEYINGCSNDERIKKYFDIITKIIDEKQKLQTELENEIKELKKFNKNQILAMKTEIQNDFKKIRDKKIRYDEIINILREDFQNKWIPAPLYSEVNEEIEVEKINEDVPENTIRIQFGETNYIKSNNQNVWITARLEGTNFQETWEQKSSGNWYNIFEWKLAKSVYDNISERKLIFTVCERLKSKEKHKADGEIPLSELKTNIFYENKFPFKLKTKRMDPVVKISFKIRNCKEPTFQLQEKRVFCFTKFYPAFKEGNNN